VVPLVNPTGGCRCSTSGGSGGDRRGSGPAPDPAAGGSSRGGSSSSIGEHPSPCISDSASPTPCLPNQTCRSICVHIPGRVQRPTALERRQNRACLPGRTREPGRTSGWRCAPSSLHRRCAWVRASIVRHCACLRGEFRLTIWIRFPRARACRGKTLTPWRGLPRASADRALGPLSASRSRSGRQEIGLGGYRARKIQHLRWPVSGTPTSSG
jgi:hypothetical protein